MWTRTRNLSNLAKSERGVMALTAFQALLGAITIGLSLFRGGESSLSAHHHALLAEANSAAALLGQYHARSANAVTTNNTICSSLLGPRFSVEADNISMDESAMVACPRTDHYHRRICARYKANKPRAAAKLAWIRTQQTSICRALSQMSGRLDGVMSGRATSLARGESQAALPGIKLEVDDPSASSSPWGQSSWAEACKLAAQDASNSNMVGHAFPLLMELMVPGLPKALIGRAPQIFCGVQGGGPVKLPEVPSVAKSTQEECRALESDARAAVAEPDAGVYSITKTVADFPAAAVPYLRCEAAGSAPFADDAYEGFGGFLRSHAVSGAPIHTLSGDRRTRLRCRFQEAACREDMLPKQSQRFLQGLNLPSMSGGEARAPSAGNWNHAPEFRARARASLQVSDFTLRISDGFKTVVSFGAARPGEALRRERQYSACSRWYFADGPGSRFEGVEPARQSFVQGWSHALTSCR
jgi:hypothetical protein